MRWTNRLRFWRQRPQLQARWGDDGTFILEVGCRAEDAFEQFVTVCAALCAMAKRGKVTTDQLQAMVAKQMADEKIEPAKEAT